MNFSLPHNLISISGTLEIQKAIWEISYFGNIRISEDKPSSELFTFPNAHLPAFNFEMYCNIYMVMGIFKNPVSHRVVTLKLILLYTHFSFVWNLKVISCTCSIRPGNTLYSTVSYQVCLTHGHPGYFSLLPWQHFSALLCLLIVLKMNKKTNGKMSDTEKQRLNSHHWLSYFVYELKARVF